MLQMFSGFEMETLCFTVFGFNCVLMALSGKIAIIADFANVKRVLKQFV